MACEEVVYSVMTEPGPQPPGFKQLVKEGNQRMEVQEFYSAGPSLRGQVLAS